MIHDLQGEAIAELAAVIVSDGRTMSCPVCEKQGGYCGNVHLGHVRVLQGQWLTTVAAAGDFLEFNENGPGRHRGSVVCVSFWAECGHQWQTRFTFHKGKTATACDRLPDAVTGYHVGELWRS